jgi:hypothetical protein
MRTSRANGGLQGDFERVRGALELGADQARVVVGRGAHAAGLAAAAEIVRALQRDILGRFLTLEILRKRL